MRGEKRGDHQLINTFTNITLDLDNHFSYVAAFKNIVVVLDWFCCLLGFT